MASQGRTLVAQVNKKLVKKRTRTKRTGQQILFIAEAHIATHYRQLQQNVSLTAQLRKAATLTSTIHHRREMGAFQEIWQSRFNK